VALAERRSRLLTENIQGLRTAFREVKQAHPFKMEAIVILPDHLHCNQLASFYLQDPNGFWRICELNDAMLPDALAEADIVKIPTVL
jgi:hypothetical protein